MAAAASSSSLSSHAQPSYGSSRRYSPPRHRADDDGLPHLASSPLEDDVKPAFSHSHFHQWMNTSTSPSPPHIDVKKAARHRSDAVDYSEESNKRLKREGEQPKRDDDHDNDDDEELRKEDGK